MINLVRLLREDVVYNFINSMVEESKYCSNMVKKHFNKEFLMTKKDNEDLKNSAKCWIFYNAYVDGDVKVRDHCHITEKSRGCGHRNCNIKVKVNRTILVVFHNQKIMIPILICKN